MVKRLIWTEKALNSKKEIFEYWNSITGNKKYSRRLESEFEKIVKLLLFFPDLGKNLANYPAKTIIVRKDYTIIYKVLSDKTLLEVKILQVWDTRRDPDDLKI